MTRAEHAYLTVIDWPPGMAEPDRAGSLVEAAGMDLYQAKLACRRNTPGVMARIDAARRRGALDAMHARGVLCIAPTERELAAYPPAINAIGIQQFPGASPASFVVMAPDGAHWTFCADDARLVVSGRIKATTSRVESDHSAMRGALSIEHAMVKSIASDGPHINRNTRITELLDLHIVREGTLRLVRLVGPRTRIGIVGDESRPSLLDDSRPLEMAMVLMPGASFDTEFHDFDPPGNIRALARKRGHRSGTLTMESWAFYSPWIGIIRQALGQW